MAMRCTAKVTNPLDTEAKKQLVSRPVDKYLLFSRQHNIVVYSLARFSLCPILRALDWNIYLVPTTGSTLRTDSGVNPFAS